MARGRDHPRRLPGQQRPDLRIGGIARPVPQRDRRRAYDVNGDIEDFSARGPGRDGGIKPTSPPPASTSAPPSGGEYGAYNGTSMAAPPSWA
ncbi:hypothetical protein GCM10029992_66940 [Glycomyces albus]